MNITGNHLADLIRTRRRELNLTQKKLQAALQWSENNSQYISNVEKKKCQFPPKHINRLSIALHIDRELIIDKMIQDYKESLIKELSK